MKKRIAVFIIFILLSFCSNAFAMPDLQLPFEGGLTLNVTRAYDTASHRDYGFYDMDDRKALDFVGDGCDSWNSSILAVATGTVIDAHGVDDNGYGKYVIIDHDEGYHSRYAHLNSISVCVGQYVYQGQEIGKMGNTGNVQGTACPEHEGLHLHFAFYHNGDECVPEPMSGYTNFTAWNIYTSMNCYNNMTNFRVGRYSNGYVYNNDYRPYSMPFTVTYYHNNGADILGYPISNVYLMEYCSGCTGYGAEKVYVQDFQGGACGSATLVMNMLTHNIRFDYPGVVYPIHGQMRDYWYWHFSELGAPVSNEHGYDGFGYCSGPGYNYIVQWFEPSENNFVAVVYDIANKTFQQYNESSYGAPPCTILDQAKCDNLGCPNGDCGVGGDGTEPSSPSYTYSGSWICEGKDANNNPINPRTEFAAGDTVCSMAKIDNACDSHRWKTEFYCNGSFSWADESPWMYPEGCWDCSVAAPLWTNVNPGNYIAKVWLDTGSGYELLAENAFTVTNSGSDYVFSGAWICEGWEYGSPDQWDLQPINPKNSFTAGDTVYSLAKASDIFVDHRWKTEFYCNGVFSWADESPWLDVGSGWAYSSATPSWANIGLGDYEAKVWLDTGSGYELKAANNFTVNPPQAQTIPYAELFPDSGGFILENNNGQGSMYQTTYDSRECLVISNNQAGECWHVQAKKVGFVINNNTPYMHQIIAKADQPGRIYVVVQRDVDPWNNFGLWHAIDLTTEWQSFSLQFNANDTPDPNEVRYGIMIGQTTGNVYVDYVGLEE